MKKLQRVVFIASTFFTVLTLIYLSALAISVSGKATDGVYTLLLKNVFTLFGFSCVVGVSSLILTSRLPSAARRVLHVLIIYASAVVSSLIMANPGSDARQVVLFVFVATFLFIIAYGAYIAICAVIKKAKDR